MMMTRAQGDTNESSELGLEEGDTARSLGRMLLAMSESEHVDFEHERISSSVRQRLFGLGSSMHIGPYPVVRRLGAGGMGEVYECRDEQLERTVAIKLVRGGESGQREQEALTREAKAMAKLAHPNVVTVFEVGSCAGRTFIVMEYVQGQTLARWLCSEPSWRAVLDRFLAAGRGLAAAHRAGLVHRDFKPDNVLLGAEGSVKVTDFGLALTEPQVAVRDAAPASGGRRAAGTTRYMPREQLRGQGVDARSDQFAFCSALYEGLWGELPFVGLEREQPAQPHRSHGLWPIVRRGLAPAPDDRWRDMDALLSALERVPRRGRRIAWSFAGTLAGVCLGALALSSSGNSCERLSPELAGVWDEARRVELERHLLTLEHGHAKDSAERVLASLDGWSSRWLSERERVCREGRARKGERAVLLSREHCLDRQRAQIRQIVEVLADAEDATLARGVVVLGEFPAPSTCADASFDPGEPPPLSEGLRVEQIRDELDQVAQLRRLGLLEPALDRARALDAQARSIDYGPVQAQTRAELAKAEDEGGVPQRSAALYDEAIDLAEIHHRDQLSAELWMERAELSLFDLRDPVHGALSLHRAEIAQARTGRPGTRARFAFNRARVAELNDELEAAQAGYAEALELARELFSPNIPTYASHLARVSDSPDASLALRREAFAFAKSRWGARHPRTAEPLYDLGLALDEAGLGGEAELLAAVEIWTEVHGRAHPKLGEAQLVLAWAAIRHGKFDVAERHASTLASILAEVAPARAPGRGGPDQIRAKIRSARGEHESALEHALIARDWFELASPSDPRALSMGREVVDQLLALGRLDDAAEELMRMLSHVGEDPGQQLEVQVRLAELALRTARLEQADLHLREAAALELPERGLIYELLRALVDHRLGRLEPAQLELVRRAREGSPLSDEHLLPWFDELELSPLELRLFD